MIDPQFNVDLGAVDRFVETASQRAARLAPAFKELRRPVRGDQRQHAKDQSGPDSKWAARSPITEARRQAANKRTRRARIGPIAPGKTRRRSTPARILGRVPAALVVTLGDLFIRVAPRIAWAAAQAVGDRVGHHHKVELKPRPFLWISQQLIATAERVLGEYIVKESTK